MSADLLATRDGRPPRWLVEVKAASGAAGERLVADLERHLDTWPQLRAGEPVAGGALIVNHQHGLPPAERTPQVYSRSAFVETLKVSVVSTLELFHWWRHEDWAAIRNAIIGPDGGATSAEAPAPTESVPAASPRRGRHWWQRGT